MRRVLVLLGLLISLAGAAAAAPIEVDATGLVYRYYQIPWAIRSSLIDARADGGEWLLLIPIWGMPLFPGKVLFVNLLPAWRFILLTRGVLPGRCRRLPPGTGARGLREAGPLPRPPSPEGAGRPPAALIDGRRSRMPARESRGQMFWLYRGGSRPERPGAWEAGQSSRVMIPQAARPPPAHPTAVGSGQ